MARTVNERDLITSLTDEDELLVISASDRTGSPKRIKRKNAGLGGGGGGGASSAADLSFSAAGNVSAANVQTAIEELDAEKQPLDAGLTALAGNSTNGLWAVTGSGATGAARTIAGSAPITVTNGDGVSGNPTLSIADAAIARAKLANGTANTLLGYSAAGVAAEIIAGTGITIANSVISAAGGAGGGGTVNVVDISTICVENSTAAAAANKAALQTAFDSGDVVWVPPGVWYVNGTLTFGANANFTMIGAGPQQSQIVMRTASDILACSTNTSIANRGNNRMRFDGIGLFWDMAAIGTVTTASSKARTGMNGEEIGVGALVFEDRRKVADGANKGRGFGENGSAVNNGYWTYKADFINLDFGAFDVSNSNTILDAIGIYVAGKIYASKYINISGRNKIGYGYVENPRGVHRITGTSGNNFVCSETCKYAVGEEIILTGLADVTPTNFAFRTQRYEVTAVSTTNFTVKAVPSNTAVTSPSFTASKIIYAMYDGDEAGEYSPDQNFYINWDLYTERGGMSVVCNHSSAFQNIVVYGPKHYAWQAWGRPTGTTDRKNCRKLSCSNGYLEGPTSSAYQGDPYFLVDASNSSFDNFPHEVAPRNGSVNVQLSVSGSRNYFNKLAIEKPATQEVILTLAGDRHVFVNGIRPASSTVTDGSTASKLDGTHFGLSTI